MQKHLLIALAALTLLSGCSGLRFPGVYRIDIEQGNIVDETMLGKLRTGMTEAQAKFVMGSPQLTDPFEPGRWVYLYRLQRGNGDLVENRVVLWFADGKLARWEGQALPPSARNKINTTGLPASRAPEAAPVAAPP
ncbi:MAG: outer membrane protein assembly factor BamE [Pseudomonadota bacterium]